MSPHGPAIAALMFLMSGPFGHDQQPRNAYRHDSIVTGRVEHIHAPRLFTVATDTEDGPELLVFLPNAEATPLAGTTVTARGMLRRFEDAGIENSDDWNHVDGPVREELASHAVLVATSIVTSTGRQLAGRRVAIPIAARQPSQTERPPERGRSELPIAVRPGTVADLVNSLAGRFVRVSNARVVGVFDPRVFLIEPQSRLPWLLDRMRVLVFIEAGTLRVDPALLVASTVTVAGDVRTLLGMQVTREVPWPPALTRDLVKRLEIQAAVLARSVQTPEGVDLTVRFSPTSTTAPALRQADTAAAGRR